MEYQNTMLCSGYSHELKPCEHIMNCDLCTGSSVDTNGNETVLDNCMGSGSTGVACVNTNRDFIGIELNKDYFNIAKQRITGNQK